jgi:transglycosylase-like protein with SLT domain/D-alanyl-D-alanine carboxypeptidase-like protein/putative Flp pilus-assembly TadE/G-like protein
METAGAQLRSSDRAQALIVALGAMLVVLLGAGVLAALGGALAQKGRLQRATDLAALSAARSMRDDFERLFVPPMIDTRPNPRHLARSEYLARARTAALEAGTHNGLDLRPRDVSFPAGDWAPVRVKVEVKRRLPAGDRDVPVDATATAELSPPTGDALPLEASGSGYTGPLAYRQGKPMRPDVARAFDRMEAAARADGVRLIVTSGYRSDAEQAKLYAQHPDPKWVAPAGKSLHRWGTELDLGPRGAYRWLARNAERFHFVQRYSWEPWHYGYTLNPRSTPEPSRGAGRPGDGRSAVPSFVPAAYQAPIARAASRWNVSATLLAAQLYAESGFNPFAVSPAGARGIAQFMPGTARAYGLRDPFDPAAAIQAQARLMRDLLRRFGTVPLALAAYNAGPAAVAGCGCIPPYPETHAYVARVLMLMGHGGEVVPGDGGLEVRLVE